MEFTVEKEALVTGLQQVMNVVGTRLTMPILLNVLIEANAEQRQIRLSTTNLDIGICCAVAANVTKSGAITLPVKKLASIVKAMPAKEITFALQEESLVEVTSGGSHFRILGLPAKDFPQLSRLDGEPITLGQDQLLRMLKRVSYSQSKDENRYILNGVYFLVEEGALNFVATDGRRLALISDKLDGSVIKEPKKGIIVPARTIAELERTLGIGEQVRIVMADRQIAFSLDVADSEGVQDSIYMISKVVEGKYPEYKQVIPPGLEHCVKVERERLLEVIQRVALVADEKNYSIRLRFEKNTLTLSAKSPSYGEASEILPIVYEEDPVTICFNPQFLMDPLKVLTNDELTFEFKDELSPGVIKTNDTFLCVVMPLRLN